MIGKGKVYLKSEILEVSENPMDTVPLAQLKEV